jgi:hypothetical protein
METIHCHHIGHVGQAPGAPSIQHHLHDKYGYDGITIEWILWIKKCTLTRPYHHRRLTNVYGIKNVLLAK